MGQTWIWIGVGALKPLASIASSSHAGKPDSSKAVTGLGMLRSSPARTSMSWRARMPRTSASVRLPTAGCSSWKFFSMGTSCRPFQLMHLMFGAQLPTSELSCSPQAPPPPPLFQPSSPAGQP